MTESDTFTVRTGVFEGPLDLLLSLINERKLYINELSLSQVTDDYLTYIQQFKKWQLSETAQFVYVAATLLLIKSRSLLPDVPITEEEIESIEDLERRLKYYQLIKHAARTVALLWDTNPLFRSAYKPNYPPMFSPGELSLDAVFSTAQQLIHALPTHVFRETAHIEGTISLEEMIKRLQKRIQTMQKIVFTGAFGTSESKVDLIVQFLAILELMRAGDVLVEQDGVFGDIVVQSESVTTPQY